jgi:hypothetical protein
VAQVVSPEFKPQYHQKERKKEYSSGKGRVDSIQEQLGADVP